jgi:hypothetical protein
METRRQSPYSPERRAGRVMQLGAETNAAFRTTCFFLYHTKPGNPEQSGRLLRKYFRGAADEATVERI